MTKEKGKEKMILGGRSMKLVSNTSVVTELVKRWRDYGNSISSGSKKVSRKPGKNVVLALLFVLLTSVSANALTLQAPWKTEVQKWEEQAETYVGVPFKHRIYGDLDAEVMRVVDGDTLYVKIPSVPHILGYEIGVRVYGIDTREMSDGGAESKKTVEELLPPGTKVQLRNIRRGKYFRIVADVLLNDGLSLGDLLIENDLAYPYYGGKKRPKGWKPTEYEEEEGE